MKEDILQFNQMIDDSQRIVFFTGAGASTESDIPDFRSADGIFMEDLNIEAAAEEVVSHSFLMDHPKEFFDFYFDKLVYPEARPNSGHYFMAELEQAGKSVAAVTQNIDGLHQKAGLSHVYELHGSVWRNYCSQCGKPYSYEELELDEAGIPRCQLDGAMVRPDVVLYGEGLDEGTVFQAIQAIAAADMLVVVGSSLNVYPAAGFIQYYQGNRLVVINKSHLALSQQSNLVFQTSMGRVIRQIKKLRG